jgi:hypothetical protein
MSAHLDLAPMEASHSWELVEPISSSGLKAQQMDSRSKSFGRAVLQA